MLPSSATCPCSIAEIESSIRDLIIKLLPMSAYEHDEPKLDKEGESSLASALSRTSVASLSPSEDDELRDGEL